MALDCFMKIEGIEGESTDSAHAGEIELLHFSHAVSQDAGGSRSSSGSASGGRCNHGDLTVTKSVDKATPELLLHCCNAKHIPTITISVNRAGEDKIEFMNYKLADVIVSSVGGAVSPSDELPSETVTFNYGTIEWE